jgi:hypothetical protein
LVNYLIHHKVKSWTCKKLSNEEVDFFNGGGGYEISHIKFIDRNGKEGEAFYTTGYLRRDISSIKKEEVKIGRFVNSILKKIEFEFKPTEVEDFVSKYKTAIQIRNDAFDRFEIVSGDDIKNIIMKNHIILLEVELLVLLVWDIHVVKNI